MARIREADFTAAYSAGKDWVEGRISEREALERLVADRGMNPASASPYIRNLRQMINGEPYQRTLNLAATVFYLDRIVVDFGEAAYRNALQSLKAHLDYYAELSTGHEQPSLRKLLRDRSSQLPSRGVDALEAFLAAEVAKSLELPADERRRRLRKAPRAPSKSTATVTLFKRNPDVIAEVLIRAGGLCEACGKNAPFLKRSNGKPYLEVHHRVRLADDGEDTVENAIALCPNCHRCAHYG